MAKSGKPTNTKTGKNQTGTGSGKQQSGMVPPPKTTKTPKC